MKRLYIVCTAVLALASGIGTVAEDFTMDDYLRQVESGNPDLALSRTNSAIARETEKQARAALLPTLAASAGYNRNMIDIEKPTAVASLPTGGPLIWQDVDQNLDNELTVGLGLRQKIFSAESIARYEQAKKNSGIQLEIARYTRVYLLTVAKKIYAQVQLAQGLLEVRLDGEDTAEEVYRNVERKFNAGSVAELELRVAEVEWKKAIAATAEARKNHETALMAFKTLAGLPIDREIRLVETFEGLPELPALPAVDEVLAGRPDYRAQLMADEIASISQKAAYGSFLPEITGSLSCALGKYGNEASFDDYSYEAMIVGLNITMPLYTGGYRLSLMETARLQKEQSSVRIRQKRDEIQKDIVSIRLRMEEARESIETARAMEAAAIRASSLAISAFENGLGTRLSVSEANTNLSGARLNLQNAIFAYRSAWYDWEFATGQYE